MGDDRIGKDPQAKGSADVNAELVRAGYTSARPNEAAPRNAAQRIAAGDSGLFDDNDGRKEHRGAGSDVNYRYDPKRQDFEYGNLTANMGNAVGAFAAWKVNWTNLGATHQPPNPSKGLYSRNWREKWGRIPGGTQATPPGYQPGDLLKSQETPVPNDLTGTSPELRRWWEDARVKFLGDSHDPTNPGVIQTTIDQGVTGTQKTKLVSFKAQVEVMFNNPEQTPHFATDITRATPKDGLPDIFQHGPDELAHPWRPNPVGKGPVEVSPDLTNPTGPPKTINTLRYETSLPTLTPFKVADWPDPMDPLAETPANKNMVSVREAAKVLTQQRYDFNESINAERRNAFAAELRGRQFSAGRDMATFALAEAAIYGIDYLIPRDQISNTTIGYKTAGPMLMTMTGKEGSLMGKYGTLIGAGAYVTGYLGLRLFSDGQSKLLKEAIDRQEHRH